MEENTQPTEAQLIPEAKTAEAPKAAVDPNQKIETAPYVPTYRLKPEFKAAILKAIGQYPFNQIAGIMNAIQVDVVDHNTFQQIVNVLGNFPYQVVAGILQNINQYVEQIVEE
jgi:ribosomal protein L13E